MLLKDIKRSKRKRSVLFVRGENNCTGVAVSVLLQRHPGNCLNLPKKNLNRALEERPDMNLISFPIHQEVLQPQGSRDFGDLG